MSKILVFDTETNGFKGKPLLMQIGYIVYDTISKEIIFKRDELIKIPENTVMDKGAFDVHGISKQDCLDNGQDLMQELLLFQGVVKNCEYIIAHNLSYDKKVMLAQFEKVGLQLRRESNSKMLCTMKSTASLTANGKWPKLNDLHILLFGEDFDGAHDAFMDVKATLRCFIELLERGHYENIV